MKTLAFTLRNTKEIIRDPLTVIFGLGFPVAVLLMLSLIQANIPVDLFRIEMLSPGIAVFGLSFISLFAGMLISKDRYSAFIMRLYISPMKACDFIIGYILPLLPIALIQMMVCYAVSLFLGLNITVNILIALAASIPAAVLFIAIGLLAGSLFSDKQVGGLCGALLTNLCAWLSGIWFDIKLLGSGFESFAKILPFYHAVEAGRLAVIGKYSEIPNHILIVSVYAFIILAISVWVFTKRTKNDNI